MGTEIRDLFGKNLLEDPIDKYNVSGNGSSDDTSAFATLEADITRQSIDLCFFRHLKLRSFRCADTGRLNKYCYYLTKSSNIIL